MFIIDISYKVPLETVDQHLAAHVQFLNEQYELGHFVASGRKVPRTGGIILSPLTDRTFLEAIIARDPFNVHDLADYVLTEFIPSKTSKELQFLLG
ncbi:YciI family protein [Flavilitoribacter nigricans]|uniref:GTP cyclohydrolase n=1 Tax=Flavilitoribacter nigricans (strain ATCC 23147 / DSM 23189 / NBRC 102662 / NCIMB 1420 / SS-2) TaxID=1122177 RepID=A0A2D0NJ43_FLAN2|nr:YciI family protein [Flavilitoribacter nigricans]PHN08467.1 GTP cyclohydrolase [Flavilitoribacter nigricans DSM 23189 = NBRC 102662]